MSNLLIVTDVDFWILGAGHRVRILEMIEFLSRYFKVAVVYTGKIEKKKIPLAINFPIQFINQNSIYSIKEIGCFIENILIKEKISHCIIEFIHNSYLLNYIPKNVIKILDTHDIVSDRSTSLGELTGSLPIYSLTAEQEIKIFNYYDYVILICKPDFDKIKKIIGKDKLILTLHSPKLRKVKIKKKVNVIGFIASEYQPNQEALQYFLNNCWSLIQQKADVKFHIYGRVSKGLNLQNYQNVEIKGFVRDINQIYDHIDIAINPVRFGAGMKIKTLEALAQGVPLVTTTHGARGLELEAGKLFLTADHPLDFVSSILMLIQSFSLRLNLSTKSFEYMNNYYSRDACFKQLVSMINKTEGKQQKLLLKLTTEIK